MKQNWFSADTATVHNKGIFELLLGYLFLQKERDMIWTPGYSLFCETKWRRSGAHGNRLFHFILSFTTDVTNKCYRDSKTLIINVVCTGLFISLSGY